LPFTPHHRGGEGEPLVLLHGFSDTWRTWELVLAALERHHDVLALTLPGHAGGPRLPDPLSTNAVLGAIERSLDAHGIEQAHIAGNSLGGYVALRLAASGRARSVVALAPAGGWAKGDPRVPELFALQARLLAGLRMSAPQVQTLLATPEGRRRATALVVEHADHIPADLIAGLALGAAAAAPGLTALLVHAAHAEWELDAARVDCPVRIIWGTADKLLPWPSAAVRYRTEWLPHADWVELDGVGHAPQLDVPLETAELILGLTSR
jgi:pimeloyl-ACP methyl ester carboxylesterase